jgi:L-histidine Nalpha-methyltransferase / hercynylcysteine S-oxide synthase
VNILLHAFEGAEKTVEYYALDLSLSELHRTLSHVSVNPFNYVRVCALHGTYDDGLAWLSETAELGKPTCVMHLGSSLGNFSRNEASGFLSGFAALLQPSDSLLVGLDACQDPIQVYRAYNDSQGVTHHFYRNGLDHANNILGFEAFKQHEWNIIGSYNDVVGRHEAFYEARKEIAVGNARFQKGDMLKVEDAYKYSSEQSDLLWRAAGLIKQNAWSNKTDDYRKYSFFLWDYALLRSTCTHAQSLIDHFHFQIYTYCHQQT